MIRKSIHKLNEVLDRTIMTRAKKNKLHLVEMDGDLIYMSSQRYQLFKEKGTTCVECGVVGIFFAKEKTEGSSRYHFNLYALKENGEEVLMTKDHIFPKSLGGKDVLENYQPMCIECNMRKGNKIN